MNKISIYPNNALGRLQLFVSMGNEDLPEENTYSPMALLTCYLTEQVVLDLEASAKAVRKAWDDHARKLEIEARIKAEMEAVL